MRPNRSRDGELEQLTQRTGSSGQVSRLKREQSACHGPLDVLHDGPDQPERELGGAGADAPLHGSRETSSLPARSAASPGVAAPSRSTPGLCGRRVPAAPRARASAVHTGPRSRSPLPTRPPRARRSLTRRASPAVGTDQHHGRRRPRRAVRGARPAPAAALLAPALNRAAAASRATAAPTSATSGCGRRSRRSTTPRPKCRRGTWTATR